MGCYRQKPQSILDGLTRVLTKTSEKSALPNRIRILSLALRLGDVFSLTNTKRQIFSYTSKSIFLKISAPKIEADTC